MRMNASTVFKLSCSFPFKLHVFIWSRFIVIKLRFIIVFIYSQIFIYFAIFAIKTLRKSCDFIIGTVNLAFETLTCLNGFLVTIRLNHD